MPAVSIIIFQDADETAPVREYLASIDARSGDKCLAMIARLAAMGHELRRPAADIVAGTDLYELRVRVGRVNHRILYFFHGRTSAVLAHAFAKEDVLPPADIRRAETRMADFRADPDRHTYRGDN